MNKLEVSEEIDEIMAEMEERTPKPRQRNKSSESFQEAQAEEVQIDSLQYDEIDASHVRGVNFGELFKVDTHDARSSILSIFAKKPPKPGKLYPSRPTSERYYDFTNENVGVGLIFNQVHFKGDSERKGSTKDAQDLKEVLTGIGFKAEIFTDFTIYQIENLLHTVSKQDHSDNDCLLVTIMSHGKQDGKIYARDGEFHVQALWELFIGNKCPTLVGKPKLFFIQACRGSMTDPGTIFKPKPKARMMAQSDMVDANGPREEVFVIPTLADLLVMYSTAEGFYSFRNPADGSWFIQALCDELRENPQDDLMTILTGVNRRVAYAKQSFVPGNDSWDAMKQMPNILSMLTKTLYFTKKPYQGLNLEEA